MAVAFGSEEAIYSRQPRWTRDGTWDMGYGRLRAMAREMCSVWRRDWSLRLADDQREKYN